MEYRSWIHPSPSSSRTAYGPLGEDLAEDRVVFVFIDVVNSDVPEIGGQLVCPKGSIYQYYTPLKIIWPRILVLLIGTEGADIAWRVMDQTMSHHLILAFKPFPACTARTAVYGTEMGSVLGMHVCMGAGSAR